jgi:hypothetical protein
MMTHFPDREGVLVRLGGGYSKIVHEVQTPVGDVNNDQGGVGALFGVGYAFWLGKSFNLMVNLDQSFQWYNADPGSPTSPSLRPSTSASIGTKPAPRSTRINS